MSRWTPSEATVCGLLVVDASRGRHVAQVRDGPVWPEWNDGRLEERATSRQSRLRHRQPITRWTKPEHLGKLPDTFVIDRQADLTRLEPDRSGTNQFAHIEKRAER